MKIRKFVTATVAATALTAGLATPAHAQAESSLTLPTPEQAVHFSESIPVWITGFAAMPFILGSVHLSSALGICVFPDSPHLCE